MTEPATHTGDFLGTARSVRRVGAFGLGQWTPHAPGHHLKPHGHAEAHFMYVPPGINYETRARGARNATGAHLIYNPPQTWHGDRMLDRARFFTVTLFREPRDLASRRLTEAPRQIGNPAAHAAVERLVRSFDGSALHLESLCFELLDATARPEAVELAPPPWLKRALALLADSRNGALSVRAIANDVGVHPVHLARGFRRFCGATPGQYLLSLRLDRAARLLGESRLSVAEIALECGFADQSHFTHQFRRAYAVPPARFRAEATHVAF